MDIIKCLLEHGADPRLVCKLDKEHRTAQWIVMYAFGDLLPEKAAVLDAMFVVRERKSRFRKIIRFR